MGNRVIILIVMIFINVNLITSQQNDTIVYEYKLPEFLKVNNDNNFDEACFCFDSNNNQIEFNKTNDDDRITVNNPANNTLLNKFIKFLSKHF